MSDFEDRIPPAYRRALDDQGYNSADGSWGPETPAEAEPTEERRVAAAPLAVAPPQETAPPAGPPVLPRLAYEQPPRGNVVAGPWPEQPPQRPQSWQPVPTPRSSSVATRQPALRLAPAPAPSTPNTTAQVATRIPISQEGSVFQRFQAGIQSELDQLTGKAMATARAAINEHRLDQPAAREQIDRLMGRLSAFETTGTKVAQRGMDVVTELATEDYATYRAEAGQALLLAAKRDEQAAHPRTPRPLLPRLRAEAAELRAKANDIARVAQLRHRARAGGSLAVRQEVRTAAARPKPEVAPTQSDIEPIAAAESEVAARGLRGIFQRRRARRQQRREAKGRRH